MKRPEIRIESIEAVCLDTYAIFVFAKSDSGHVGLGECYPIRTESGCKLICQLVNDVLAPLVVGRNALKTTTIWNDMYYQTTSRQGDKGLQLASISGIDIALWDLKARVLGVPIADLLGGSRQPDIPLYISVGGCDKKHSNTIIKEIERYVNHGFEAAKIRMHWGSHRIDVNPKSDIALFAEIKEHFGDSIKLSFDANNGYSVKSAIKVGHELRALGAAHFEEPVAHYDYEGLRRIADKVDIPIAAGEQEYTLWQFKDLMFTTHIDIVQPDILKCGGITNFVKIMNLAESANCRFMPHQNQTTIGLMASAQVVSTSSNIIEYQEFVGNDSVLENLFEAGVQIAAGKIILGDLPGLGIELGANYVNHII